MLSLYSRLILLNIRTDLKRVIVTVVSVAGCCALVVIGFTLKAAVDGSVANQYDRIVDYDQRVMFDTERSADADDMIERQLRAAGTDYAKLFDGYITYRVTNYQVGELFCGDLAGIGGLYHLLDWQTGRPLAPTDDGILIQKRLAEIYGLDVGDELEIAVGGTKPATARIAGVFDNYIGRAMLMSDTYYETLYGEPCAANSFFVRLNGADADALGERLSGIDGFESWQRADADRQMFDTSASALNALVALLIFLAAVMAGVVLMNLTNIYILQKKRELTIMRVNGFSVGEVIGYVTRETVATTVLGILLGIGMGAGIAYRIVRAMEQSFIQFERSVSLPAWLLGAVITAAFTIVINVLVLRQVKHLKLTDVA